ncbi:MAG: FecR domain-containing protein [Acidobacteriota bacterium]
MVRRTALGGVTALAAVAMLALTVRLWPVRPPSPQPDVVLAVAERVQGSPRRHHEQDGRSLTAALTPAESVRLGDDVETGASSRAALRADDGSSIRIDYDSRVRFLAPSVVEVTAGAVYIETAAGSQGFEVRTPIGTVRDVGTQFEVRVLHSSLRLRVRTGAAELRRGDSVTAAAAGTETTATAGGVAVRRLASYGVEWAWTADVAPPFAIEGRPLSAFLDHLATEQGWRVDYADPQLADTVRRIILHGSLEGLTPEEALAATLATSGLHYRIDAGTMVLSK